MSSLRISPDLFLGSQELNKWQKFLQDEGYKKLLLEDSISFGIVHKDIVDGNWTNFLVQQGTNSGTIKINEGIAINKDCNMILFATRDNIAVADDNTWKWIKVSYQTTNVETGTVSIAQNGSLSGVGTKFTETLRGGPNNASRISFPNSSSNIYEYDVLEVISDTEAILMGDFSAESNISYACIGSFTPDTITPSGSKYPFQYDSCVVTLVNESVLNTPPTLIDGEEFLIARIRRSGSTLNIEDKRSLNIYRSKTDYSIVNVASSTNPLIGPESIKFDSTLSPRSESILYLAWTFRSNNFTVSSSDNRVTILAGNGGKYKTTSDFQNGDFNGWRLYTKDGSYSLIKESYLSATQINLVLDTLNVNKFSDTAQQLIIAPNAEEIELRFKAVQGDSTWTSGDIPDKIVLSPINVGEFKVKLNLFVSPISYYSFEYRYKNNSHYSQYQVIPTDNVVGFFEERSFDDKGNLLPVPNQYLQVYEGAGIPFRIPFNTYTNVVSAFSSGDVNRLEYLALSNASPVADFVVGQRSQHVIITNDPNIDQESDPSYGPTFTLSGDLYLNFRTDLPGSGLPKNTNAFFIKFRGNYDLNGHSIFVVQDYQNPVDIGYVLLEINGSYYQSQIANDNLSLEVRFDGTDWIAPTPMVYENGNSIKAANASQPKLLYKVVDIGDWNMSSSTSVDVVHGIANYKNIRSVTGIIRDDADSNYSVIGGADDVYFPPLYTVALVGNHIGSTTIKIARRSSGFFDNTGYDSTGFNRGWLTIMYTE